MASSWTLVCFLAIIAATFAAQSKHINGLNWINGNRNEYKKEVTWMLMPDDSGKPTLALLGGPQIPTQADLPNDVLFYLYTKSNQNNGYRINVGDTNGLNSSPYNSANPTKFIIHGFTNEINSPAIQEVKNAYLSSGSYNVIGVDWGALAGGPLYNVAKANTVQVGQYVGQMINFLNSNGGSGSKTHVIGHSLGAHVSGIAADSASGTVSRVTALDAALPLYADDSDSVRVDPSDASFVDVIHTCGGWLGFKDTRGHADFYPNGGVSVQPGCGSDLTGSCSHGRAYEFFAESVKNHNRFPAHKCSSVANAEAGSCDSGTSGNMGDGASTSMRGIFWMST